MSRLSKDALLGASDLREEEVDLPTIGGSVVVQGLGAAFSNQAQSEALEARTVGNTQIQTINVAVLEEIQLLHGLKDPALGSRAEARQFMESCGPAARTILRAIDRLSDVDKDAIEKAEARFPGGGAEPDRAREEGTDAAPAGSNGSPVPVRAG